MTCTSPPYLLTYAHRSQWSIGHQRPPAIALCSGLLLSFWTSWSPAVSALCQCLASNCCEAGLSSSSLAGSSRSGLDVWCWMLASWGCVQSSPTSSAVSAWPLVPVPLAPTNVLGVRRGVSLAASFRFSLHCIISLLDGDPSLPRWVLWFLVVEAFVTRLFYG